MTIPRKTPVRKMSLKREALVKASGKIPFSTILGERKPVKKKNARRSKANFERAYGEHAAFIRSLPCIACGFVGATEAAHTTTGGMGRKADAKTLVPLCGPHVEWAEPRPVTHEGCHRELHRVGIKTFEAKYGLSLSFHASRLYSGARAGGRDQ